MKDEDVLFRSIKGISYISISPLILLTASLWFTPDNLAVVLAHLAQLYFSVFYSFYLEICGLLEVIAMN